MDHVHPLWWAMLHEIFNVSTMSVSDYVNIVATYHKLLAGDKKTEDEELLAKGYTPEAIAALRAQVQDAFHLTKSCGLKFTKPLDRFDYDQMGYLLTLHKNYERGLLPFPGSVSDQPGQVMEMFVLISELGREQELIARAEAERKNGRNKHKNQPRNRG